MVPQTSGRAPRIPRTLIVMLPRATIPNEACLVMSELNPCCIKASSNGVASDPEGTLGRLAQNFSLSCRDIRQCLCAGVDVPLGMRRCELNFPARLSGKWIPDKVGQWRKVLAIWPTVLSPLLCNLYSLHAAFSHPEFFKALD